MTDATPQKPAADWYPDPSGSGQLRFWDGEQWTQELRAQQPSAAQAGAAQTGAAQPSVAQSGDTVGLETSDYGLGFAGAQPEGQSAAQAYGQNPGQSSSQNSSLYAGQYAGQQGQRQQHAHSGQVGFFRSLFDLSFAAERSVTTSFVKVIYVIGIVLAVLGWLGGTLMMFIMGGISSAAVSAFGGSGGGEMMIFAVLSLVLGWIPGFINIILLRVGLEFVTAQIRTSQHTAELVRLARTAETRAAESRTAESRA